ncbi:MAG: two-component system response regulator [Methanoculleus sp. SDB]|nr:MAG: two-component system response regulator [Methanoculleus sp. SDB]
MTHGTILVVEDDIIIATLLQTRLKKLGFSVVHISATAEDAIMKATELKPDLALMDIRLKGESDGIGAAEAIREKENIPVIYLTSHSDEDTLERAKKTKPAGYIIKPFTDDILRTTIEIALYSSGKTG